jgi:hypothetical protein
LLLLILAPTAATACTADQPPTFESLPACPEVHRREPARYEPGSGLDFGATGESAVCRYTREVRDPLRYGGPTRFDLDPARTRVLVEALEKAEPFDPANADCLDSSPVAVTMLVQTANGTEQLSAYGPGCGFLHGQGLILGGGRAMEEALTQIDPSLTLRN